MWRGTTGAGGSDDVYIPPDHDSLEVLNAIKDASVELFEGCICSNKRRHADPVVESNGTCNFFRSSFININHAYTALALYAHRKRIGGRNFKLKTIALAGDLGGRGINFKPHGFGHDPTRGTWIVPPHQGYLTDMFFMFDATKSRQITTHGEYVLQAIGRLCTLTTDAELAKMENTPPRLWTSFSCYNIIETFSRGVKQWVAVMRNKRPGESIKDALVRNIRSNPQLFAQLYMIYALPTTDPRWARKHLWVRQSRLMRADNQVGEHVRDQRRMPPTPRSHGITHDPDADRALQQARAIAQAEEMGEQRKRGELDDDGDDQEDKNPRKSQRLALPVGFKKIPKADVSLDDTIEGHSIIFKWNDGDYHQGEIKEYLSAHPQFNFDVDYSGQRRGQLLKLDDYKHGRTAKKGSWVLLIRADRDEDYYE